MDGLHCPTCPVKSGQRPCEAASGANCEAAEAFLEVESRLLLSVSNMISKWLVLENELLIEPREIDDASVSIISGYETDFESGSYSVDWYEVSAPGLCKWRFDWSKDWPTG